MPKKNIYHGIVLEGLIGERPITIEQPTPYAYVLNKTVWLRVVHSSKSQTGWFFNFDSNYDTIVERAKEFDKVFIALVMEKKVIVLTGKEFDNFFDSEHPTKKQKTITISEKGNGYLIKNSITDKKKTMRGSNFPREIIKSLKCVMCDRQYS